MDVVGVGRRCTRYIRAVSEGGDPRVFSKGCLCLYTGGVMIKDRFGAWAFGAGRLAGLAFCIAGGQLFFQGNMSFAQQQSASKGLGWAEVLFHTTDPPTREQKLIYHNWLGVGSNDGEIAKNKRSIGTNTQNIGKNKELVDTLKKNFGKVLDNSGKINDNENAVSEVASDVRGLGPVVLSNASRLD